jgi:hypothetical protein
LETIDPRDRWEPEQLYEFEGFVVLKHLLLQSDQTEQYENIDAEEWFAPAEQEERSEHINFLLLQLN